MQLIDNTNRIAREFLIATGEPFAKHPLADLIRNDWPSSAQAAIGPRWDGDISIKGSPGLGNWNEAPWLAFFHKKVTDTARAGFYPIFLYEPGFETYCLVLAQGTDLLREVHGRKVAREVISKRATELRSAAKGVEKAGFTPGPFYTFSRLGINAKQPDADGWSSSVAFGKRYQVDQPPPAEVLRKDMSAMLRIYDGLASVIGSRFSTQDADGFDLAALGELPTSGFDGAVRVAEHKRLERRYRNGKLAKAAKAKHGPRCQGCLIDLAAVYPGLGVAFLEAHHTRPLADAPTEGVKLTVDDFTVLCPTCHRAIHRHGCPPLGEFATLISSRYRDFYSDNT